MRGCIGVRAREPRPPPTRVSVPMPRHTNVLSPVCTLRESAVRRCERKQLAGLARKARAGFVSPPQGLHQHAPAFRNTMNKSDFSAACVCAGCVKAPYDIAGASILQDSQ